jgi:hypothetical protein
MFDVSEYNAFVSAFARALHSIEAMPAFLLNVIWYNYASVFNNAFACQFYLCHVNNQRKKKFTDAKGSDP